MGEKDPATRVRRAFGEVIRDVRLRQDLSQEELAHAAGRHPTFISMIERGLSSPTLDTIVLLARALHVRPSELLKRMERALKW